MHVLFILVLFLVSVFSRVWIRLGRNDFGVDTWYFLNYAEGFRKQRKLPVHLKNYLLDIEEQWYPPLTAFIVSLLPQRISDKFHWIISAIADSLQAILLYIFCFFLTKRLDIALFAFLLYCASTINASLATNLNARPFASLVLILVMISLYNYTLNPIFLSLCVFILLGVLLLHTHKMASQQFLFFAVGFFVLTGDFFYLYTVVLIFICALILSRGFYLKILKNNIQIVRFWSKNLPYLLKHQVYESPLYRDKDKAARVGVSGVKSRKFMFFLARVHLAALILIVIIFWLSKRNDVHIAKLWFFFFWVFINFFTVISTTYLPLLKYIGEGFLYLNYGVFPISLLVAYGCVALIPNKLNAYLLLGVLVVLGFIIQVFTLSRQNKNTSSYVDQELKDIFAMLKNSVKDNVMCLPVSKAEPLAYFTGKKVLWGGHGSGWDALNDFFPIIRVPIDQLIAQYQVSFVLVDKRFIDFDDIKINNMVKVLHNGENYLLAEIIAFSENER